MAIFVCRMICLVDSDTERDSNILTKYEKLHSVLFLCKSVFNTLKQSRRTSVMPLDVRGVIRATLRDELSFPAFLLRNAATIGEKRALE